ncbi:hypothetical protein PG995_016419 [Apiospora arundinis]
MAAAATAATPSTTGIPIMSAATLIAPAVTTAGDEALPYGIVTVEVKVEQLVVVDVGGAWMWRAAASRWRKGGPG